MTFTTYQDRPLGEIETATLERAKRDLGFGAMLIVNHKRTTGSKFVFTAHIAFAGQGEFILTTRIGLYGITQPLIATGFIGTARNSEGFEATVSRGGRSIGQEVRHTLAQVLGIDPERINYSVLD